MINRKLKRNFLSLACDTHDYFKLIKEDWTFILKYFLTKYDRKLYKKWRKTLKKIK